jgi:DNA (cytosine-5)-methyltransferase 1
MPCLGLAIGDLPPLAAGEGSNECDYDPALREAYFQTYGPAGRQFQKRVLQIGRAARLWNHVARYHSSRDLGDFEKLLEGENSATAMRVRKVEFDFPYDRSSFKDRYTRQSRSKPCSTIVAHLSKDGLMSKVRRRVDRACIRLCLSGGAGGQPTPRDRHSPPKEQAA